MSALSDWIEAHGMTEDEAYQKSRIGYADWSNLMAGYYTIPSIALVVGHNLGMTPEEVRPLGRCLSLDRFYDSDFPNHYPECFNPRWYKQVSYYRTSKVTRLFDKPKPIKRTPMRFCVVCGKQLNSGRLRKYCAECSTIVATRVSSSRQYTLTNREIISYCPVCGKKIESETRTKYCSTECQQIAAKNAELPVKEKTCEYCGKTFAPRKSNQKYCSKLCCDYAFGNRKPPVDKQYAECPGCGVKFIPNRSHGQIWCSTKCRKHYQGKLRRERLRAEREKAKEKQAE